MASRVTQTVKVNVVDMASATAGGNARVTQVVKVVVSTIPLVGNGRLASMGVGQ